MHPESPDAPIEEAPRQSEVRRDEQERRQHDNQQEGDDYGQICFEVRQPRSVKEDPIGDQPREQHPVGQSTQWSHFVLARVLVR
ncbi:MAG TPA: hypothetical protein VGK54_02135 [Chloroflexota bacterium]